MVKFATDLSGAILLPSSIQVMESISGSVVPLAMFLSFIEISDRNGSVVVTPALFDYQGPCTARYIAAA